MPYFYLIQNATSGAWLKFLTYSLLEMAEVFVMNDVSNQCSSFFPENKHELIDFLLFI